MIESSTTARATQARRTFFRRVLLHGAMGCRFAPISDRTMRRFRIADADAGK